MQLLQIFQQIEDNSIIFMIENECFLQALRSFATPKNTGAWKGRLKRFFVDPYTVKLAKNGANIT